ncbi:uncharacterized protein K460DRAFT_36151 [Cucurbitaria berberidis CBS 394.84]|uniref:Dolichyl-diphosphooligosaccharide-protein glycosyltransferase subunit OST5 n=1 Tax=Cucurbitaria berberidis CBS 394.84 TaxID=1168544 RepID=A0A9P4LDZ6_9PLEO|nr:uncharacterized protein K460DRAFT_36151 [Cucurbitaria berberidis CBS 394.84]KAF1851510.1 hypothetical protein K460DRAFT_36151 [Cucurbitaria berberidis CBS 394.84]
MSGKSRLPHWPPPLTNHPFIAAKPSPPKATKAASPNSYEEDNHASIAHPYSMSSPLVDVWEAAASSPFSPTIGKNTQFTVGFLLLFASLVLTTIFSLNRSVANLPVLGVPASLAFGFGAVYMICAVGVYV